MEDIWEKVKSIFSSLKIIYFILAFVFGGPMLVLFKSIIKFFKLSYRLHKNLTRKVYFLSNGNLYDSEYSLLSDSEIFNIEKIGANDERALDILSEHKAIILGYSDDITIKFLRNLIAKCKSNNIALIVCSHYKIPENKINIFKDHLHFVLTNSSLRLLSDLYSTMITLK